MPRMHINGFLYPFSPQQFISFQSTAIACMPLRVRRAKLIVVVYHLVDIVMGTAKTDMEPDFFQMRHTRHVIIWEWQIMASTRAKHWKFEYSRVQAWEPSSCENQIQIWVPNLSTCMELQVILVAPCFIVAYVNC